MAIKFFIAKKGDDGVFRLAKNQVYDDADTAASTGRVAFGRVGKWFVIEGNENGVDWPCSWTAAPGRKV